MPLLNIKGRIQLSLIWGPRSFYTLGQCKVQNWGVEMPFFWKWKKGSDEGRGEKESLTFQMISFRNAYTWNLSIRKLILWKLFCPQILLEKSACNLKSYIEWIIGFPNECCGEKHYKFMLEQHSTIKIQKEFKRLVQECVVRSAEMEGTSYQVMLNHLLVLGY